MRLCTFLAPAALSVAGLRLEAFLSGSHAFLSECEPEMREGKEGEEKGGGRRGEGGGEGRRGEVGGGERGEERGGEEREGGRRGEEGEESREDRII